MDKETLKRQIVDEVQAEYETKLREIKRQKTHAEEELESASERWRTERRRLNSEIDRLESSLAEAKTPSRRKDGKDAKDAGDGKAGAADPQEIAKIQAAAEEKVRKATAAWEVERAKLASQVAKLEAGLAEAIERSSNPHRAAAPARERFEAKLADASKDKLELEQQVLRLQAGWDEDKKKLSTEIMKLRRLAPSSKALEAKENMERMRGRTETFEETRIKELEERLTRANTELQKGQQNTTSIREDLRRQYDSQLDEAHREKAKAEGALASATQQWQSERAQFQDQIAQLQRSLHNASAATPAQTVENPEAAAKLSQALGEKQAAEEQLQELAQKHQQAVAGLEETRRALESQLETATRERSQTEAQLQAGQSESAALLEAAKEQLATASKQWETERQQLQAAQNEVGAREEERREYQTQLEAAREQLAAASKQWETERQQLQAGQSEAGAHEEERRGYQAQLEAASHERQKLEEQLAAAGSASKGQEFDKQAAEARIKQLQDEYEAEKTRLVQELQNVNSLLEVERARVPEAAPAAAAAPGAAPAAGGEAMNGTALKAEIDRVQKTIKEIEELIDNPATELSTVIKKNVEKAEMEAYVKGMLFSIGGHAG